MQQGQKTEQPSQQAYGNPPPQPGQQGDKAGEQQGPAQREGHGPQGQQAGVPQAGIHKPEGIVQKDQRQEEQGKTEGRELLGEL